MCARSVVTDRGASKGTGSCGGGGGTSSTHSTHAHMYMVKTLVLVPLSLPPPFPAWCGLHGVSCYYGFHHMTE